jgi:hypothetical protein
LFSSSFFKLFFRAFFSSFFQSGRRADSQLGAQLGIPASVPTRFRQFDFAVPSKRAGKSPASSGLVARPTAARLLLQITVVL